jgi:hypothetical protein
MSLQDHRGHAVSGAGTQALETYEQALAAFQCWRTEATAHVGHAIDQAPAFVMAHVLRAWMLLCSREPSAARSARPILDEALRHDADARERLHLAAIAAVIDDDHGRARSLLDAVLEHAPRDVLALQVAHAFDYLAGDTERLAARTSRALRQWPAQVPGRHAVLAMHAFGLEETGAYEAAQDHALLALALNPRDARAVHVLAHVCEMTGQADAGVRLMGERLGDWAIGTAVATHCWWHLALFHLEAGRIPHVLALYDRRIRAGHSTSVADLVDASALLWRVALAGVDTGRRWRELAASWDGHIADGFCTFSDLHAMLAFVGANDEARAARLIRALEARQALPTRHGRATARIGLPACRALLAFGRRDWPASIEGLAPLAARDATLGGSRAQRDVFHLTLRQAIERVRARRPSQRRAA